MTVERIREAFHAKPFRPFYLSMADGRRIRVPSQECMLIPPKAERTIVVSQGEHEVNIIDILMVTSIDYANGRTRPRRAS